MLLLRHGQSEFNLHFSRTRIDPGIEDPHLTPLGHEQAERAAVELAGAGLRRIVVSPYTRALQTAAPIARALDLPVFVTTAVRERYAFACDVGSPRSALMQSWPAHDFAAIEERWWPTVEEPIEGVLERAARFRTEWSARTDWAGTLVISHWGFILSLTGRSIGNGEHVGYDPTAPAPAEVVWKHH
ncbi:MAG: histidine phosphatase family protein [Acetobacteraceae bacterium]|nr:histidine phosphatase family protein [Acetobacteraceae bacterium]